jgi:3-phenylpropionate/trans-cinnamate dioxygenase ferredoxin reductase subunit
MSSGVLVVGAGQAAGEFAFRLRQAGYTGPVTLVGAEAHLPYQRPPLSKAYLSGEIQSEALMLRSDAAYAKADIGFIGSTHVTALDPSAHQITLQDGRKLPYEKLVLATGGRARRLSCPGHDLAGIYVLRTLDDVLAIRAHLKPGARLVIIGGGYIGLEVAAVAIKHGLVVTVLEAAPRLLARVAGAEISAFYDRAHRQAGVDIHTGAAVTALHPSTENPACVGAVELADGRSFPCDFVLAGIGLIANVELAEAAGLPVGNGILVDEYCRTTDPHVLSIGDCANHPNALMGRRLRLESVPNAIEQARVAAETICGRLSPYAATPWFWSDQYDLKLQAVGLAEGHDEVVVRGDMQTRAFTVFYLRQGVIVATDSVNRPADFMAARKLVGNAVRAQASVLADTSVPLKELAARASVT